MVTGPPPTHKKDFRQASDTSSSPESPKLPGTARRFQRSRAPRHTKPVAHFRFCPHRPSEHYRRGTLRFAAGGNLHIATASMHLSPRVRRLGESYLNGIF